MTPSTIGILRTVVRGIPLLAFLGCVGFFAFVSDSPLIGAIATVIFVVLGGGRVVMVVAFRRYRVASAPAQSLLAPRSRVRRNLDLAGWIVLSSLTAALDVLVAVALVSTPPTAAVWWFAVVFSTAMTVYVGLDGYLLFKLRGANAAVPAANATI